jgi:hypothetical protein
VASLCGASEAALLGDRQEIPHLPQLDLYPHLINVSEKKVSIIAFLSRLFHLRQ